MDAIFPEKLIDIIEKNGLNPTEIELEITESSLTTDIEKSVKCIERLKKLEYILRLIILEFVFHR